MQVKKALLNILVYTVVFFLLLFFPWPGQALRTEWAAAQNSAAASVQGDIRIFVNGKELLMDVPPLVEKGRTLVPVRFLLEAMGAQVQWKAASETVAVYIGKISIQLVMGAETAHLNGRPVPLDVPARIMGSRAYVPLRFVSENLGAGVAWDGDRRIIFINSEGVFSGNGPAPMGPPVYYQDLDLNVQTYGVALGDAAGKVLQLLGEPVREEGTIYGYCWWVYNHDLLNYLLVGIRDGKVAALYTCGQQWSFGPVRPGTALQDLKDHFKTATGLYVEETNTIYKLHLPTLIYEQIVVTFYYDSHDNNKIVALRLEDREAAGCRFARFFKYRSSSQGERAPYNLQQMREAEHTDERQIFDLANVERARRGLPLLTWHPLAARAALEHSREMFTHGYFAHVSEVTGKTLAHRLDDQGVDFRLAAENIAKGQLDGLEVHHGLMNSSGHRNNILNGALRTLGVGVYRDCFTQNFVTER
jgi:uncharacterized protein YkwD